MNPIVEKILDRADDYRCADYEDRWEKRQAIRARLSTGDNLSPTANITMGS